MVNIGVEFFWCAVGGLVVGVFVGAVQRFTSR